MGDDRADSSRVKGAEEAASGVRALCVWDGVVCICVERLVGVVDEVVAGVAAGIVGVGVFDCDSIGGVFEGIGDVCVGNGRAGEPW